MNGTPGVGDFWRRRWRGAVPWRRLFWRDMLAVGSLVNLATGFAALLLVAYGQPIGWALAVHFSPVPYNIFLLVSLWRCPDRPGALMPVAGAWFAAMLVV